MFYMCLKLQYILGNLLGKDLSDQNLLHSALETLIEVAITTSCGSSFQSLITRCKNYVTLNEVFALGFNNFILFPLW